VESNNPEANRGVLREMKNVPHLRVILASPGDVEAERNEMQNVVDYVNQTLRILKYNYHLERWRWETDSHPGLHAVGPQGIIDDALRIEDSDLLVGIFWKRLGTPVADAGSGTEHEVRKAIAAWKRKGSPQVMLYFNGAAASVTDSSGVEQVERLSGFKRNLLAEVNPLVQDYIGVSDFRDKVQRHLFMIVSVIAQRATFCTHSPLRFAVMAEPVRVRSEGMTELLGDIFLRCTFSADHRTAGPLWFSAMLFLNTSVTSRLVAAPAGTPSLSEVFIQEVGRPGVTDVYAGVVKANSVVFGQIFLTGMLPEESRTFRITNLRCNANSVDRVFAAISLGGLPVENDTPEVAVSSRSLRFEVRHQDGADLTKAAPAHGEQLRPSRVARLRFEEEFPNAFKTRVAASPALIRTESGGGVYLSESNPSGPLIQLPGSPQLAGMADHGTRFRVHFMDLPPGMRLLVSERNTQAQPALMQAKLVESAACMEGGERWVVDGVELREVPIVNGTSVAVWELIEQNPARTHGPGSLDFLAATIFRTPSGQPPPFLGRVSGSFAPAPPEFSATAGSAASSSLRVPRFIPSPSAPSSL
jgi:hypothetical protein